MYNLKGFVRLLPLIDNAVDSIAGIGELSDKALTYGKDKGIYTDPTNSPSAEFISFYSANDAGRIDVDSKVANTVLKLGQFLLNRGQTGGSVQDPDKLREMLLGEFQGAIKGLSVGEIIRVNGQYYPTWISYEDVGFSNHNSVTLWFSDTAFRDQYNQYEIEVIPPITNIDDFFMDPLMVKRSLEQTSMTDKINAINMVSKTYPSTHLTGKDYDYHDPQDKSWTLKTTWVVVIWGNAGFNQDAIKNAIQNYILTHSTKTRDQWATLFPDLFLNTEFIIVPFFNKYAIPNKEIQGGIYSPTLYPDTDILLVKKLVKGAKYTPAWVGQNTEYSHNSYKSLGFAVVGHPDNRDGIVRFFDKFRDYLVVTNDSPDFNRMSARTQAFCGLFSKALKLAEMTGESGNTDINFPRIPREGVIYVSFVHENVTYLVANKASVMA